ncbi:MAG: hypothetical protein CVU77_08610 [Elusimicrobia bacterium HGW-Elusimicrobia-1]|nr:MAG: hypothetical protein CVU77_08610 [Elusimicrobia bacterium HGW-Elusimicrobia-1]
MPPVKPVSKGRMAIRPLHRLSPALIFFSLLFTLPASRLWARGLDINVSVIKLVEVVPGVEINVGKAIAERIIIRNTGDETRKYAISFHKPSQIEVKWNSRRYEEIPDVGWLRTPYKEIIVAANSEKDIFVYLKIPRDKKNYGKRFCAVMAVSEVPDDSKPSQIVLAVYPLFEIATLRVAAKAGLSGED